MTTNWQDVARATLAGAEADTLSFPDGLRMLEEAGVDGYAVDFRRSTRAYYRPGGEAIELVTTPSGPVAAAFDAAGVKEAIREAQELVPGYTYHGFCAKVARAGCAGYIVSLGGRRLLYYGRDGDTHTEYFPATPAE